VPVDSANGLQERCVVACDHITTVPVAVIREQVGRLLDAQEADLAEAIRAAFDSD
jgi:mRNA interferase MazF